MIIRSHEAKRSNPLIHALHAILVLLRNPRENIEGLPCMLHLMTNFEDSLAVPRCPSSRWEAEERNMTRRSSKLDNRLQTTFEGPMGHQNPRHPVCQKFHMEMWQKGCLWSAFHPTSIASFNYCRSVDSPEGILPLHTSLGARVPLPHDGEDPNLLHHPVVGLNRQGCWMLACAVRRRLDLFSK